MKFAVLIAGPTGVGKSIVAAEIAAQLGGEIINADSMQVYADLCVLTARPRRNASCPPKHHLYGFVDGAVEYGLANWLKAASETAGNILTSGRVPVFVGGTGLYLSALELGYDPIRRRIIEAGDQHLQAVASWEQRGSYLRSPPSLRRGIDYLGVDRTFKFVLERHRADLYERINANFAQMASAGGIDEVARLLDRRLPASKPVMKALGVRELGRYLDGSITLSEAVDLAQRNSRKFARRQITWFRNQMKNWEFLAAETAEKRILASLPRGVGAD
jgi:tRNA dimethylallyltransferase